MAQVCKWINVHLCWGESPKADQIHPAAADGLTYDAVIVWKAESPKEKTGGMAYEVILKPASSDARPSSPPKERPISQEFIDKKLKDAEERRQSVEAVKLQPVQKDKERAQEANRRIQELNDSFSKQSKERLEERLENMEDRKTQQIQCLQTRLKEHVEHVKEVKCRANRLSQGPIEMDEAGDRIAS